MSDKSDDVYVNLSPSEQLANEAPNAQGSADAGDEVRTATAPSTAPASESDLSDGQGAWPVATNLGDVSPAGAGSGAGAEASVLVTATDAASSGSRAEDAVDGSASLTAPQASVDSWRSSFEYASSAESYSGNTAATTARGRTRTGWFGIVIVALVAGLVGGYVGANVLPGGASENSLMQSLDQTGGLQEIPSANAAPTSAIAKIAAAVLPTVVCVNTSSRFGGGNGSGQIIKSSSNSSYVLTNNHVIVDVAQQGGVIDVQFQDGTKVPATLVGRDPSYDLAVLKIKRGNLPVIPFGNSDSVSVGDTVVAIGSPLGLNGTVTSGIVSSLHRPVTTNATGVAAEESFISAIQTDAAINPGNSGGPLVDSRGRMIGVNSAIATLGQSGGESGNIGVGFSIPINQARRVADEIIRTGTSSYPIVGVVLDSNYNGEGARIRSVTAGGPADDAGVRAGDIITRVNGRYMDNLESVITAIRSNAPGDKVVLSITRGARSLTVTAILSSRPSMQ